MDVQSLTQSPKPYTPITNLRERARAAYEAERESAAAERADQLARAQRNLSGILVDTCAQRLHLAIDLDEIETWVGEGFNPQIAATVIVDAIELRVSMPLTEARIASPVQVLGNLTAVTLCPVCSAQIGASEVVATIADIGRLLGRLGCICGWMPDAVDGEVTA